jgi:hypothetical protein
MELGHKMKKLEQLTNFGLEEKFNKSEAMDLDELISDLTEIKKYLKTGCGKILFECWASPDEHVNVMFYHEREEYDHEREKREAEEKRIDEIKKLGEKAKELGMKLVPRKK